MKLGETVLPYYIAYFMMFLFAILLENCREKGLLKRDTTRKVYCIGFAAIWILLLGCRHPSMGVDLGYGTNNGYLINYSYLGRLPWKYIILKSFQNYEVGYRILNKGLYMISSNPQFLLFVCAGIAMTAVSRMIWRYSDYPFLSGIIYLSMTVFLANYSALRQAIAISIIIFSFDFVSEKKFWKFTFTVFLASLFHYTAVIFLAAYPIYHFKMKNWMKVCSIFAIPIVYLFKKRIFLILASLIKDEITITDTSAGLLFFVFYLVYIFTVIFETTKDVQESGWRNLFFCCCFCQIFSGIYSTAMRVAWYFMPFLILLLPRIIKNNCNKTQYNSKHVPVMMYLVLLFCFTAFGIHLLAGKGWAMTNPYQFFWS